MASLRHQISAEAASIGVSPRQPATMFADAAALSAYADEAPTLDTQADRIVGAILQLAPRLHAARTASGALDMPASERSLRGLRLGIAAPSGTHCALADRLRTAFGMSISCGCHGEEAERNAAAHGYHLAEDTDTLLSIADVVVATDGADFRIDNKALNAMQPHAIVIADPSAVDVDQMALAYALWFETIAGAGIVRSAGASLLLPEVEKAHNVVVV